MTTAQGSSPSVQRTAVVTAAAGAMGSAIVLALLDRNMSVVATDISGRRLDALRASAIERGRGGGLAATIKADSTRREAVEGLAQTAYEVLGSVDVLVNVVGGYRGDLYTGVLDIDDARFDSTVDMTLRSTFLCTQAFGRGMVESGYGRIVNIGSISMNGAVGQADYAGLKAAVIGFTRTCAMELAPAVTVNAVIPGVIETSVMERMSSDVLEDYAARIPLRRWGQPEDVAAAVAFLASDEAAYITGEDLYVSGGFRSWI